jgi:hypothetical protein
MTGFKLMAREFSELDLNVKRICVDAHGVRI